MGSVSLAIGNAAREAGAHIVTSAEVLMPRNELGLVHKLSILKRLFRYLCLYSILSSNAA